MPEIAIITNALVGTFFFIYFLGKVFIDFAGFSVFNHMAGKVRNDLEGKRAKLKNYY